MKLTWSELKDSIPPLNLWNFPCWELQQTKRLNMKTENEVEKMLGKAEDSKELPKLFGQTYQEGVQDSMRWFLENMTDKELLNEEE
jgi:hypothetical protein